MGITLNIDMVNLPFGERPAYGSPYPEGISVGYGNQFGDASGGAIEFNLIAPCGFLYRIENLMGRTDAVTPTEAWTLELFHIWAQQKSGFAAPSFQDLVHMPALLNPSTQSYQPLAPAVPMIRRFALGRVDIGLGTTTLAQLRIATNVLNQQYLFSFIATYWRKESTYLPGFLSSFYESPVVPGVQS